MKLGIILSTNRAETNWNAFRLANLALQKGDEVSVFMLGEGVEYENGSSDKFNIKKETEKFLASDKAKLLACNTCLKIRHQPESKTCPISTLEDLYSLIKKSGKLLTF